MVKQKRGKATIQADVQYKNEKMNTNLTNIGYEQLRQN